MDIPLEENSGDRDIDEVSQQKVVSESDSVEAQVASLIDVMKQSLSQVGRPKFKEFWDARMQCVDILKMPMGLGIRQKFWDEVSTLSKEARSLKQFFDRDVSYEIDQIQLAFQALEEQLEKLDSMDRKLSLIPEYAPEYLLQEKEFFESVQSRLEHMQGMLSQVQALRKEILASSIRAKTKTSMLDRSSRIMSSLFNLKRDFTGQISDHYLDTVQRFLDLHASVHSKSPHQVKDEIKFLQILGKSLSITPDVFLKARELLSEKWDQLKKVETDIRETIALKKTQYKELLGEFAKEIEGFAEYCISDDANGNSVDEMHKDLLDKLKTKDIDKDTFKTLKVQLARARDPFDQKIYKKLDEERQEAQRADEEVKRRFHELKAHYEDLILKHQEIPLEKLEEGLEKAKTESSRTKFASFHSQVLGHLSFQLQDVIQRAKDQRILSLSPQDQRVHEQLKSLYEEKVKQRAELKKQLETSRKSLGTSGLDFEKAIALREKLEHEKQSYDRLSEFIDEIEHKLADLQNQD